MKPDPGRASVVGFGIAASSTLGLGVVMLGMPADFSSRWGTNPDGARLLTAALGVDARQIAPSAFPYLAGALLALAWIGYAMALIAGAGAGGSDWRRGRTWGTGVALLTALVFPSALSVDVFAYLAYALLPLGHGLNPYAHSPLELRAMGDALAPYLRWDMPSPYGPLWTAISIALVAPLKSAPLVFQILAFKLLAAGALIIGARAARDIAEHVTPGRGPLAELAVLFCPLLLVEGPGGAHNDLAMVALMLVGMRQLLAGRHMRGELALGAAVAIKIVAAPVIALVLCDLAANRKSDRRAWLFVRAGLLMAGPSLVLATICGSPVAGLAAHFRQRMDNPGGGSVMLPYLAVAALLAAIVATARRPAWARGAVSWHLPWLGLAVVMHLFASGVPFPWYATWAVVPALSLWRRRDAPVVAATLVVAFMMMAAYILPAAG